MTNCIHHQLIQDHRESVATMKIRMQKLYILGGRTSWNKIKPVYNNIVLNSEPLNLSNSSKVLGFLPNSVGKKLCKTFTLSLIIDFEKIVWKVLYSKTMSSAFVQYPREPHGDNHRQI